MMRTLLICLLAFALPMQGAAAAAMVFCGPHHHDAAAVAAAAHETAATHAATQPGPQLAAPAQVAATGDPAEVLDAAETAAPSKFATADVNKCSVCAACCSSAAMHQAAPKLPVVEAAAADFAALASSVEPCAVGGPERPPRPLLA